MDLVTYRMASAAAMAVVAEMATAPSVNRTYLRHVSSARQLVSSVGGPVSSASDLCRGAGNEPKGVDLVSLRARTGQRASARALLVPRGRTSPANVCEVIHATEGKPRSMRGL